MTAILDFEKPIMEIQEKIEELKKISLESGMDLDKEIETFEQQAEDYRKELYANLKPSQKLQIARHPERPNFLDYVNNICEDFIEFHGDREGMDDRAIIGGIAKIDGKPVMIIGTMKGKSTKENLEYNFGMPQPQGYRKALRLFKHANKFNLPIITLIDTPGAYPGISAEETNQGGAIAVNLRDMAKLEVPVIAIITGEGCSGGALGLAVANKVFLLEHAYYTVISPEGCASILWRDATKASEAADALKITAKDLLQFDIIDGEIKEPTGGAHVDYEEVSANMKKTILDSIEELSKLSKSELKAQRYEKFRKMGVFLGAYHPCPLRERVEFLNERSEFRNSGEGLNCRSVLPTGRKMADNYLELQIKINPEIEDIMSDFFFENLPCEGVILAEETYKDLEMVSTTEGTLKVFLSPSEQNEESVIREILTTHRKLLKSRGFTDKDLGTWEYVISNKPNEDWSKKWKEKWDITRVSDKIVIVPDWLEYEDKEGEVVIRLEPGCAFGTGTHQTTQLCMKAIEKYMPRGAKMADIGMGSGILAICAKKFGASYVYGCDNDETVIDVAKENAVKNGVAYPPLEGGSKSLISGWGALFELNTADKITEKFDFVCANILHNVLAEIMGDLKNIMNNGAIMVLSGILDEKKPIVLDAIKKWDLELIEETHQDQWVALIVKRID